MSEALNPCPRCKVPVDIIAVELEGSETREGNSTKKKWYDITCPVCLRVKKYGSDKQEAINKWNKHN
jgi:hypothetical protein